MYLQSFTNRDDKMIELLHIHKQTFQIAIIQCSKDITFHTVEERLQFKSFV